MNRATYATHLIFAGLILLSPLHGLADEVQVLRSGGAGFDFFIDLFGPNQIKDYNVTFDSGTIVQRARNQTTSDGMALGASSAITTTREVAPEEPALEAFTSALLDVPVRLNWMGSGSPATETPVVVSIDFDGWLQNAGLTGDANLVRGGTRFSVFGANFFAGGITCFAQYGCDVSVDGAGTLVNNTIMMSPDGMITGGFSVQGLMPTDNSTARPTFSIDNLLRIGENGLDNDVGIPDDTSIFADLYFTSTLSITPLDSGFQLQIVPVPPAWLFLGPALAALGFASRRQGSA